METAFLIESAQPSIRRHTSRPVSITTWAASLSAVLAVAVICLVFVRDDARSFATLSASRAAEIHESLLQTLVSATTKLQGVPTDSNYDQFVGLTREEKAQIYQGYMVCCVRDDKDIPPPAYHGYFEDWPIDPVCIPGYVKVEHQVLPPSWPLVVD